MSRGLQAWALFLVVAGAGGVAASSTACSDEDTVVTRRTCSPPARRAETSVALRQALGGQTFESPIEIALGPGNRFYVLEQKGVVRVVDPRTNAPATTAIDVSARIVAGGEAGLLGIAFDPSFAENGFVYLHFTAPLAQKVDGVVFQSVVARYVSKDRGATIDGSTEKRLLVVDQPYANHNGGKIAFGPDGLLYIALGDGGSGGDPRGNGQNKDVLLGKILRIDPKGGDPYGIPPSNPFARGGGRPEIFAYGLRNPWKLSFDKATGELWAGDVGQGKYEEIDLVTAGGNYGWNLREGKHCYGTTTSCPTEGMIDPVVEYDHSEGVSITSGYVYRGTKVPSLVGKLIYGDFGSGRIWAMEKRTDGYASQLLLESDLKIPTFAQDADGEVYVADYATGRVMQIASGAEVSIVEGLGTSLDGTGCLDPARPSTPPESAIAYTVNSPLWSDGAQKERWLYLPKGARIGVGADGDFDVPPGSVAVKTFLVDGKRVETRLFVRYDDGAWAGYSYEWNDAQTDATLLSEGKTKALPNGKSWYFPSRAECFTCHTPVAGFTLGLEARQLDRDEGGENQLARFAGVLAAPIAPGTFPALKAADTPGASDEERARGYLHANCSMCHREGSGSGGAAFDVRIDKTFAATKTCDVATQAGDLGVASARLVAPGDPSRSMLTVRMRTLDVGRMPPVASRVVDETGTAAVEAWIRGLPRACP